MAKNSRSLFNTIAPVYNLFFTYQRKRFIETFAEIKPGFDISQFKTALDVGCGTGALCSVLNEMCCRESIIRFNISACLDRI